MADPQDDSWKRQRIAPPAPPPPTPPIGFGGLRPQAPPQDAFVGPLEESKPAPLTGWRGAADRALDTTVQGVKGFTGLGDQGPPGQTVTNAAAILGAALPVFGGARQMRLRGLAQDTFALDDASRMARAAQQGYHPQMYHETYAAHEWPLLNQGFDLNIRGGSSTEDLIPHGVFLKPTDTPIGLKVDPTHGPPTQLPLRHRAQNIKEFADRNELEAFLRQDPDFVAHHDAFLDGYVDINNQIHQFLQPYIDLHDAEPDPGTQQMMRAVIERMGGDLFEQHGRPILNDLSNKAREASTNLFKRLGHGGVRIIHDAGGGGRFVDTTLILDPSHVRSPTARFDPRQLSSKRLLASLLPPAVTAGYQGGLFSQPADEGVGEPPPVLAPQRPR